MNRKNMTRNALVTSIISLLLCVSLLVGTTFAWFTDSETSAGNNIKSGTLNVEMYYADGTQSVPTDATGWTDASTGAIFNYDLWEPGYAEVRHIKIANEGTLALKYQLYIVANGEVSDLSDVIDVYFMDPAVQVANRSALASVNPIGNLTGILAGMPQSTSGILEAKSEVAVTLALKMQETAGNEYQNLSIGTDFSVVLVATQVVAEDDSFGPDYDGDAWHNAMKVTNEQDLQAAINAGETSIVLENDIDLTKALEIPADAKIDLNLNGKTLSGPGVDAEGAKVHALVNNGTLTVVGGAVRSTGANGGSAIYNAKGAALTLRNITIVGAPQDANNTGAYPSYAINNYGSLVVNGADITSAHGAISVYGDTVIEDANVTVNGRGGSSHVFFIGGEGTDLVVNGGTYTHKGNIDGSLAYIQSGTTMTVNGGNFAASNGGYGLAALGSLTVNGGTFANSVEDWNGPISISGGTFAKKPVDKHIAAGYSAVQNSNGTWAVLPGDDTVMVSDGLYYDGVNTYYISNANGLTAFAAEVNKGAEYEGNTYADKTILLMNDIDLNGAEWDPIGNMGNTSKQFAGVFDGQGYTISNFKITQKTADRAGKNRSPHGFFGNVNGTIKNLTIDKANLTVMDDGRYAGILVGRLNGGLIDNCHVVNSSAEIDYWQIGGLVGLLNGGSIKNSSVVNTSVTGPAAVGAISGIVLNSGERTIENCTVKNCTIAQNGSFGSSYDKMFGAVVGATYSGTLTVNINGCKVENTKIMGESADALFGYIEEGDKVYIDGVLVVLPKVVVYDGSGIQNALNALNSGDTLVFPAGAYNTSGTFIVPAGVTIMGEEGETVVFHQLSANQDNIFNCAGDVVIKNITFETNRKGYAIADNTKNHDTDGDITVIDCKFVGLSTEKNWGIYKNLNGNLFVQNCSFDKYNNALCGINNGNGSETVIIGCTFTNIDGEAIGYVTSTMPDDFEADVIANNTGLTAENVMGY